MKNRRNSISAKNPPPSRADIQTREHKDTDLWFGSFDNSTERFLRLSLGPFLLLFLTPIFVNVAALAAKYHDSSFMSLLTAYHLDASSIFTLFNSQGSSHSAKVLLERVFLLLQAAFPFPSLSSVKLVCGFIFFQLCLFLILPGRMYDGAIAPSGFVPKFRQNGPYAFIISLLAFIFCVYKGFFQASIIYTELMPLLTLLNSTALVLSALLFVKGVVSPSTPDHGAPPGTPFLFRLYWGEELYPNIFGIDLKHFIICRIGMMSWFFFTLSFSLSGSSSFPTPAMTASATLSLLYVAKFFLSFEVPGYMSAADIAVDRFGFMLSWGTISFMPLCHSLQVLHLVRGSGVLQMSWLACYSWIAFGLIMIWLNLDADTQRHHVRAALKANKKITIWGKAVEVIRAPYVDSSGKQYENFLLVCGYHGIIRHFHYLPDIVLLFLYCAPAGFSHPLTFTYFFYLTGLLVDRCQRIDARCKAKYGSQWDEYVKRVPYKLIPGVF